MIHIFEFIKGIIEFIKGIKCKTDYDKINIHNLKNKFKDDYKVDLKQVNTVDIRENNDIDERIDLLIEKIFKPWYETNVEIKNLEIKISKDSLLLFKQPYCLSINQYSLILHKGAKLSAFIFDNLEVLFITTIIYINKFKLMDKNHFLYDYNIYYIFITSLCLSLKYNFDDFDEISTNHIITKLFGINLRNKYYLFEEYFLKKLDYNLFISTDEFSQYYNLIQKDFKLT